MKTTTGTTDKAAKGRPRSARTDAARGQAARVIRMVFGVLAVVLALGALLIVLRSNINEANPVVTFITDTADAIAGPFSRDGGIFDFEGENAASKNALLNYGIAAIVYLLVGRLLAGAIAPRGGR